MRRRALLPVVAVAIMFVVSGCSGTGGVQSADGATGGDAAVALGSEANAKQMAALYQKAQSARQSQVISYGPGEQIYAPAYKEFMRRYPAIQVVGQYLQGAQMDTKLSQEFASGKHVASLQIGAGLITNLSAKQGRCEPYVPFTSDYVGADDVGPADTYRGVVTWIYGPEYNTDKVKASQAPTSWLEFTDAKWRGKFVLHDPTRATGTTNSLVRMLYNGTIQDSFISQLADNDPLIVSDAAQLEQAVASGQRELNFVGQYVQYLRYKQKGLPIGFVFPTSDGAMLETHYECMLKDGPNPDATKLFVNWLYTPEGQRALAKTGVYGMLEGAQPAGLPPLSELSDKRFKEVPPDQQSAKTNQLLDLTRSIFQ